MDKDTHSGIFTVGIGGAAGDGVKKAGIKVADFLRGRGYEVYISFEYPSLIRGGHNFARLSFGRDKIWNDHSMLDMLIASNEGSVELHRKELGEGAKIITHLPLSEVSENPEIVFADFSPVSQVENAVQESKKDLIDGNTAFARGLIAAGLDFYISYPMTPATSILHYLAGKQTREGLKVIQPENEISAINMALGMAYAGKRAAVGSATGGFALMQEAFSFSGMAELPVVVAVSQRQAPATGVPTRSSQSDLRFVIHAGHGEFPRIVLAPGDPEESFKAGALALDLSWKFKVPAIVLIDKILSEHMMTSEIESSEAGKIKRLEENRIFPGTPNAAVKVTSYEHDESGFTVDDPEEVKKMVERRFEKMKDIENQMKETQTIKIFGDENSEDVIVFFGSTKGAVLEAAKYFNKPWKLVQILWLEPFDAEKALEELGGKKRIVCVEGNHDGQLSSLIREKTGINIKDKILRYDSLPFDPIELAEKINSWS